MPVRLLCLLFRRLLPTSDKQSKEWSGIEVRDEIFLRHPEIAHDSSRDELIRRYRSRSLKLRAKKREQFKFIIVILFRNSLRKSVDDGNDRKQRDYSSTTIYLGRNSSTCNQEGPMVGHSSTSLRYYTLDEASRRSKLIESLRRSRRHCMPMNAEFGNMTCFFEIFVLGSVSCATSKRRSCSKVSQIVLHR